MRGSRADGRIGRDGDDRHCALLLAGYEKAAQRFYDVTHEGDRDVTFPPLFEALSWAVCIDERFQSVWRTAQTNPAKWWSDGFAHGDTVRGVRFARNRVHHQWADALWLSRSGAQLPRALRFMLGEWRWRPELPESDREDQNKFKDEYDQRVAAHRARVTLGELSQCLAGALPVLAP